MCERERERCISVGVFSLAHGFTRARLIYGKAVPWSGPYSINPSLTAAVMRLVPYLVP